MTIVFVSPEAEEDLESIAAYIAQEDPRRAINFVAKIKQKISLLSEVPGLGRPRRDIASHHPSVLQSLPERGERLTGSDEFDDAAEAAGEPGGAAAGNLFWLSRSAFFSAGVG